MPRQLSGLARADARGGGYAANSISLQQPVGPAAGGASVPVDLVELHESIATLLATQHDWETAYAHLQIALQLAREHECGSPEHHGEPGQPGKPEQPGHQGEPAQPSEPAHPHQPGPEVVRLRREYLRALDASMRDELTAAYNRRYLRSRLGAALAEHPGAEPGVAIAIVDLDHFKQVNDTHGHGIGDAVLREVVALLHVDLPRGSFCARYGGEEFVLVLPDTDPRSAVTAVERARARVAAHPWSALAPGLTVTISAGLVHHRPPLAPVTAADAAAQDAPDTDRQLRRADDLLYAAKRAGRDTVAYRKDGALRLAGRDDTCG